MPKIAVIDNDFLNHLTELKNREDAFELINQFFTALDYRVVMHPLVYLHEKNPNPNPIMERLFQDGVISVMELSEIWAGKPGGQSYYETMVKQIYNTFTGKSYPCKSVCTEWKKQNSLGEVHSASMCIFIDCEYLLSDDNHAVQYLGDATKRATQKSILVYNRQQCCDSLKTIGALNHRALNAISHKVR